ncbi:MAG: carboxymuconolactone decarboxylase family protein [Solirubrobacteraceae bacterium]
MPRIAPAPADSLFRKYVYRETRKRVGRDIEPVRVMGHHTRLLVGMGGYELAMEKASKVPAQLKHLADTKVALMVGCEFCIDIGAHISAESGIPEEKLLALPRHREATCFSELERLVIDYAEAMTKTPAEVTDELFSALQEHFDEAQLVELTASIAWENWRARFNWAFDIGAAGFREGAACPVPVHEEQAASAA